MSAPIQSFRFPPSSVTRSPNGLQRSHGRAPQRAGRHVRDAGRTAASAPIRQAGKGSRRSSPTWWTKGTGTLSAHRRLRCACADRRRLRRRRRRRCHDVLADDADAVRGRGARRCCRDMLTAPSMREADFDARPAASPRSAAAAEGPAAGGGRARVPAAAVPRSHPYGHLAIGSDAALRAADARTRSSRFTPATFRAVAGDAGRGRARCRTTT